MLLLMQNSIYKIKYVLFLSWDWEAWCLTQSSWNKGRKCFHCLGAPNNLIRPWDYIYMFAAECPSDYVYHFIVIVATKNMSAPPHPTALMPHFTRVLHSNTFATHHTSVCVVSGTSSWMTRHCHSWCSVRHTPSLNPLNAKLNSICHLLALLGAHHILHVSRIRVKFRTTVPYPTGFSTHRDFHPRCVLIYGM